MTIIDLTHAIRAGMPAYPGTEPPQFLEACTIAQDGFAEKRITLFSHTGTHMDAPAHIIQGGATLDQLPIERFCGKACVVDVPPLSRRTITMAMVKPLKNLLAEVDFVLFRSGWSDLWQDERYFKGYPVLTPKAAEWISGFGLKGLGVDMISVDREGSTLFPIHRILLGRNILIIENLTHLDALPRGIFTFWCLPIKIKDGDGAPVRAVAVSASPEI